MIAPAYAPMQPMNGQVMQMQPEGPIEELTPAGVIQERLKAWADEGHKANIYDLRLITCNYLNLESSGSYTKSGRGGSAREEVEIVSFESARHNPVTTNTQIQAKSLAFNAPDITWKHVPYATGQVRRAWYLKRFKEQCHAAMYRWFLLDSLISGEGFIAGGVRNEMPFLEWTDALCVTPDPAYKEGHRKRGFFRDIYLTAGEALRLYPQLKDRINIGTDGAGSEKPVTVTCYWDKGDSTGTPTHAILFGGTIVGKPERSKYGKRLPIATMEHFRQPSVKHASGPVTEQIGSMIIALRLQRAWREIALRAGAPKLAIAGGLTEGSVDDILSGEEATLIRMDKGGKAEWLQGGDISDTSIKLYQQIEQNLAGESGVNQFMQGRTDVNVDFASQLSYLAQQSGSLAKYTAQQLDQGVTAAVEMMMSIGQMFAPDETLYVGDTEIEFGPMLPLRLLLGTDGEMMMKPGGMEYRAPAQKLQEVAVLGNVLGLSAQLPEGLNIRFAKLGLESFEIEDADEWVNDMQDAIAARLQQETAIQEQAMMAQGQPPVQGQAPAPMPAG